MAPSLAQKLDIKPDTHWRLIGAPAGFVNMLRPMPLNCVVSESEDTTTIGRIVFAVEKSELASRFEEALRGLPRDGAIWVAWPKKTSGVWTDVGFDMIQALGLTNGLVDNKVCAIDDTWTALRFVVPLVARPAWQAAP